MGICPLMTFIYINMPNCRADIHKDASLYTSVVSCLAVLILSTGLNHFPCVPIMSAMCFGVAIVGTGYAERRKNYEPIWMYQCIQITSAFMGAAMYAYATLEIEHNQFSWVSSVITPLVLLIAWFGFSHWSAMDHATARIKWHTASSTVELKELEMNPVAEAKELYEDEQKETV